METIETKLHIAQPEYRDFDAPFVDTVSVTDFKDTYEYMDLDSYQIPIASTDYVGIEEHDPRLADREWRLNNLYTVLNEDGDLVRFRLRPAQLKLLRNMHYRNIILKARQLGFTTFICIFMLDYALFNRNKQLGIIAHTQTDATVIFRKVKVAWENFPQELKEFIGLTTEGDSKTEYEFSNGSVMRISTSLRSGTYQMVLVTEFGKICAHFPEKAEEIVTGTFPAVPAKGVVFIESTAEGEDGRFHDMVEEAMAMFEAHMPLTSKDYKFFFYPWYENPANVLQGNIEGVPYELTKYFNEVEELLKIQITSEQRVWYYVERKTQRDKMKQEHPSTPEEAFLTSGNKLFSPESIKVQQFMVREPIRVDGDFKFFAEFVPGHLYGLGADVSEGVKLDSSAIVVIDFTTSEVVLTYKNNTIPPLAFAHEIKKAALWFGGCIAAPESNSVGHTTCVILNQIYTNIFTQYRTGQTEDKPTQKLGWDTNSATKPRMMYDLSESVGDSEFKIVDRMLLIEAQKYNKEDSLQTSTVPNTTRHFDLLMAAAIAWQMRIYATKGKADAETVAAVEARRASTLSHTRKTYR